MANARKLPSGTWCVQVYLGKNSDGKNKYRRITGKTRREAELRAAEIVAKKRSETSNLTFENALNLYILAKSNLLSPSTSCGYKRIAKNHFDTFRKKTLDSITNADIQAYLNTICIDRTPKTIRNIYGLFSAVMKMYCPERVFSVMLPQRTKEEIRIPTRDDISKIHSEIKGQVIELPFLLASHCGLRASEIAALKPDCVDMNNHTITIKSACVEGENGSVEKAPKSFAGYRTIPCPDEICEMVCSNTFRYTSKIISDRWRLFMKRTDIKPFKFHALRHYYASNAMLLGVPQRYIAELMGHADTTMLDRVYQHTFPDVKKQYAQLIAKQFQSEG